MVQIYSVFKKDKPGLSRIRVKGPQRVETSTVTLNNRFFKNFKPLLGLFGSTSQCTLEPVHEISNNVVCATSKASDQTARSRLSIL